MEAFYIHEAVSRYCTGATVRKEKAPCNICPFHQTNLCDERYSYISNRRHIMTFDAESLYPEIRYYMGKYKVKLLPKIAPKYKPNCRVFVALEEFPCDAVEMMMRIGEQYMTSYRYLQHERTGVIFTPFPSCNVDGESKQ